MALTENTFNGYGVWKTTNEVLLNYYQCSVIKLIKSLFGYEK